MFQSTLSAREFLVPKDLCITNVEYKKVLICGSCMAHVLIHFLKHHIPGVEFTHVFMNNMVELPDTTPAPPEEYEFQIIALPLRDIVSDQVISFSLFADLEANTGIRERAFQSLNLMFNGSMKFNEKHSIPTFVLGFVVPVVPVAASLSEVGTDQDFAALVRDLNRELARLVSQHKNAFLIDVDGVYSAIGKRHLSEDIFGFYTHGTFFWDEHWKHDWAEGYNAPQPGRIEAVPKLSDRYGCAVDDMILALWAQFDAAYRVINQVDTVKMVIFDLDDTLWRGQIAEHYGEGGNWPMVDGWPIGLWEAIQHLRARGIIIGIASKNEISIVRDRWERAINPAWIKLEEFVFTEINWNPKAENIRKMIEAAALTPKSVVFVDDNPVERESVRLALPGVRVIGSNPFETKRLLLWSAETQRPYLTKESLQREDMMRKQALREQERSSMSREEFLRSLDCKVKLMEISTSSDPRLVRSVELLNKTNQFNTTGQRWKTAEIDQFLELGGRIYAFEVADRYTAYGLVGVILYKHGHFEQFAMSCRVLGLGVEHSVLSTIIEGAVRDGVTQFSASVVETEANIVCRDVYKKIGMQDDGALQRLHDVSNVPPVASHLVIATETAITA
ncbi:HAD-IIIC family phosphatase [Agrobacterium vitis]